MRSKADNPAVRKRVWAQARTFLAERGLRGWNVDLLAEASGVAKNTLYRIIGSREQLLETLYRESAAESHRRLREIVESEESYLDRLQQICDHFTLIFRHWPVVRTGELQREYPALEELINSAEQELHNELREFLEAGRERGDLRRDITADFMLQLMLSLHEGLEARGADRDTVGLGLTRLFEGLLA
jgi:AcrR family transcriptional regulator